MWLDPPVGEPGWSYDVLQGPLALVWGLCRVGLALRLALPSLWAEHGVQKRTGGLGGTTWAGSRGVWATLGPMEFSRAADDS